MTKDRTLVIFRHPNRSPKSLYLGYEEGNSWVAIGKLKVSPEEFASILNDCITTAWRRQETLTVKVDTEIR